MTSSKQENEAPDPKKDKNFKINFPGTVITFKHKINNKKVFYDSLPVVLGVRLMGKYIFGINLKLIPYRMRMKLLNELQDKKNINPKTKKILVTKLIKSKYGRIIAAAFQVYNIRNIKGKITILGDRDTALMASSTYNSFKNIPINRLNNIIKERIKTIINPMGYIITIIKNTIRHKEKKK